MINTNKATNKGYDFSIDKPSNFNKDLKYGEKREKRVHDLLHMKAGDKFVKIRLATSRCPVGKWEKEYEFIKGQAVNGTRATTEL